MGGTIFFLQGRGSPQFLELLLSYLNHERQVAEGGRKVERRKWLFRTCAVRRGVLPPTRCRPSTRSFRTATWAPGSQCGPLGVPAGPWSCSHTPATPKCHSSVRRRVPATRTFAREKRKRLANKMTLNKTKMIYTTVFDLVFCTIYITNVAFEVLDT